jgi:predicted HicB family RNase H-like nuclease
MNTTFEYNGYIGSAEVDIESRTLVGKLLFIRDSIGYSANSVEGLEAAFREAVDDYLATCAEEGDEPDAPCKGSFNVRIGPDRHRLVAIAARREGVGLNDFVCSALDDAIRVCKPRTVLHQHEVTVMLAGKPSVTFTGEPQRLTAATSEAASWRSGDERLEH